MMRATVVWSTCEVVPVSKTIEVEEQEPLALCEALFRDTNLYEGALWDALQPLPEAGRNHTAMSVGDHVVVESPGSEPVVYRCMDAGFAKVRHLISDLRFMGEALS
jgi:hypothetical protein